MDKFITTPSPCSINAHNRKFLSFFIWQGKVYPVGAIVKLTFHGDIYLNSLYNDYVVLIDHYFEECTEHWVFFFHKPYETTFRYFRNIQDADLFSKAIESIETEPIAESCEEYINYIEAYKNGYNSNHLTKKEYEHFKNQVRIGVPPKAAVPMRFKDVPLEELNLTPEYKNTAHSAFWLGWLLFIFGIFAAGIFKDWYVQLILRGYFLWWFICWKQKKQWGF